MVAQGGVPGATIVPRSSPPPATYALPSDDFSPTLRRLMQDTPPIAASVRMVAGGGPSSLWMFQDQSGSGALPVSSRDLRVRSMLLLFCWHLLGLPSQKICLIPQDLDCLISREIMLLVCVLSLSPSPRPTPRFVARMVCILRHVSPMKSCCPHTFYCRPERAKASGATRSGTSRMQPQAQSLAGRPTRRGGGQRCGQTLAKFSVACP